MLQMFFRRVFDGNYWQFGSSIVPTAIADEFAADTAAARRAYVVLVTEPALKHDSPALLIRSLARYILLQPGHHAPNVFSPSFRRDLFAVLQFDHCDSDRRRICGRRGCCTKTRLGRKLSSRLINSEQKDAARIRSSARRYRQVSPAAAGAPMKSTMGTLTVCIDFQAARRCAVSSIATWCTVREGGLSIVRPTEQTTRILIPQNS